MKLPQEFYRLPLRFDAERLAQEINQFSEDEWRAHPSAYEGNTALILVSSGGGQNDDMVCPMLPTDKLKRCPYIQQVLASFNTVVGRSRLMRLAPGANVTEHSDINYYWRTRFRLHIPIVTDPAVRFSCNGIDVHMAAGEAWTFDNWLRHSVVNPSAISRVHLVMDTVGSAGLWNLIRRSTAKRSEERFIPYAPERTPQLALERYNNPPIMPPGEFDAECRALMHDLTTHGTATVAEKTAFLRMINDLRHEWRSLWVMHGPEESGWPQYRKLLAQARRRLDNTPDGLIMASNRLSARSVLESFLVAACSGPAAQPGPARGRRRPGSTAPAVAFDRPVFIVAAPRSGSTLLFEALANNRAFTSLGDESHQHFEGIAALQPRNRDYDSNRLTAADATPAVAAALRAAFSADLRTPDGVALADLPAAQRPARVRFLEKTPKNALRIPFLRAVFPDARFIYLHRNPRDNISSLLDSWRSGRYATYRDLPDWNGLPWSHLLIPGWRDLSDATLAEIVKRQWQVTNQMIMDDLAQLPAQTWCSVGYEELTDDPAATLQRLCDFAEVPFGPRMRQLVTRPLRNSRYTLTPPDPDKWRKNATELATVLADVAEFTARLRALSA